MGRHRHSGHDAAARARVADTSRPDACGTDAVGEPLVAEQRGRGVAINGRESSVHLLIPRYPVGDPLIGAG